MSNRDGQPGTTSLIFASAFPAFVIAVELVTGICAGALFDPVPTIGHLILICLVPIANLWLWRTLQKGAISAWPILLGGAAIAIAASYSLLFLPILPFAMIAILIGFGVLPFAPVMGMIFAARWTLRAAGSHATGGRIAFGGVLLGLLALLLVDLPATVTQAALNRYQGSAQDRSSAVAMMRNFGDREMLLRMSYGDSSRPSGVLSFLVSAWGNGVFWSERPPTEAARELYYRVTGKAFNAVERPGHGMDDRMRLFGWDQDQGGEQVGGRVPDLALSGSRIDGSVAAADNLGYLEWTVDLTNSGPIQREGRFTLALPEGAVASRATLWVNGEPREASIAGRGETRAAYESVVRASRDPLLVTTDGAQRLLVQAFPILPNSTMRMRIGITAPFVIAPDGRRSLALPAIVERNFNLAGDFGHAVWIEGDAPLQGMTQATVAEAELLAKRPRVLLPAVTAPSVRLGAMPAKPKQPALAVEQRIDRADAAHGPLMIVVDGSADTAAAGAALSPALDAIGAGRPVGLVVAGDTPVFVEPQPWSSEHAGRIRAALASTRFQGGQDGRAALARAVQAMPNANATLLWIHGAQPIRFTTPEPALEQVTERQPVLPRLVRYQATAGRALTLTGNRWFDTALLPTPSGDPAQDLRTILTDVAGDAPRWQVTRAPAAQAATGSEHIVRLWGAQELAGSGGVRAAERETAIGLAHRLNIVTPVSGAVVLETNRDYKNNGLPVPDGDAVPTIPEPEVWALLALIALAGGWMLRRQRLHQPQALAL